VIEPHWQVLHNSRLMSALPRGELLKTRDLYSEAAIANGVCDNLSVAARKSLILNGEMSEWLKEHAWKENLFALIDAHRHPPTHSRSTTSRNNDLHRTVPVSHGGCPWFRRWSDTVLTQDPASVIASCETRRRAKSSNPKPAVERQSDVSGHSPSSTQHGCRHSVVERPPKPHHT
jgi:hypothetical protein